MELLVERYGTNRLQAVIPENMNGPIKLSFEEYGFEIDMFCDEVTREVPGIRKRCSRVVGVLSDYLRC